MTRRLAGSGESATSARRAAVASSPEPVQPCGLCRSVAPCWCDGAWSTAYAAIAAPRGAATTTQETSP